MAMKIVLSSLIVLNLATFTSGHGRLIEPAARNAAWRYGFKTPTNFNDNQQNCGGFAIQKANNGKCGVCGDAYNSNRQTHVYPGKYATGVITKTYTAGKVIRVKVEITANHKGWFEFRLGKINNAKEPVSQGKLTHLLQLVEGGTRWYLESAENKVYSIDLKLPDGLTCDHCVLQWWWKCGNSWGCDDGTNNCGIGRGAQETFVNCADISIFPNDDSSNGDQTTVQPPVRSTRTPKWGSETTSSPPTAENNPATSEATQTSTRNPAQSTVVPPSADQCKATGPWTGQAAMDNWCRVTCAAGDCPASQCICGSSTSAPRPMCKAIGPWKGQKAMDVWCLHNCDLGYCPESNCARECVRPKTTGKPVLQ